VTLEDQRAPALEAGEDRGGREPSGAGPDNDRIEGAAVTYWKSPINNLKSVKIAVDLDIVKTARDHGAMAKSSRRAEKGARRRRRAYHHGDLKEALIEAGLGLLAESGNPAALGLREASRRVGVSQAAPYAHFRDKQALLAAVAERGFRMFADSMLRSAGALAPGEERLAALAQGYVAFALKNPALYRLMFGPDLAIQETETALAEAANASFRVLLGSLGGDPSAPATAAAALAAWSFAHGLALLLIDGRVRPDEVGAKDVAGAVAAATSCLRIRPRPAHAADSRAEAKDG